MWLIDELVEQHIARAQRKGDFDNLPGQGKKLELEDDSHIPEQLRTGYRLLKNSGFLPPELELRNEAVVLSNLMKTLNPNDSEWVKQAQHLVLLEFRLQSRNIDTTFLQGEWRQRLGEKLSGGK
ncbi:hypothetical protein CIG19_20880 [Enterobacterales bacterium CwR94]|nr:hypothetical protein CIG19_20880 [Enterobacterales bacterium CwR94]